jgi:hypothetical protein
MGIELLTEKQYRRLQELGSFDLKTSSWVKTPAEIQQTWWRNLFCDRRYDHVFMYTTMAQNRTMEHVGSGECFRYNFPPVSSIVTRVKLQ